MSAPRAPSFEPRRTKQLREELLARAVAWLPGWRSQPGSGELGNALMSIAARIESEATQRLDRLPEKAFRNFFAWLGVRGQAGRAARLPIVLTMNDNAEAVTADPPVQLQALAGDEPVLLETESSVCILPGKLDQLIAVDPAHDALYLPPFAFGTAQAPKPLPEEWRLKAEAGTGAVKLQLEPALGLTTDLTIEDVQSGLPYRVMAVEGGIVTIDPPLGTPASTAVTGATSETQLVIGSVFRRVAEFQPFGEQRRNRQSHALYLGANDALGIDTPAIIEIRAERPMAVDAEWWFWGSQSRQPAKWIRLLPIIVELTRVVLFKPAGSIDQLEIAGATSRWLRATRATGAQPVLSGGLTIRVNCAIEELAPTTTEGQRNLETATTEIKSDIPAMEGVANTVPLVLNAPFYPLGREPRQFDSFYLASKEAFSKANAKVTLDFVTGDSFASPLSVASVDGGYLVTAVGTDKRLKRMWLAASLAAGASRPEVRLLSAVSPPAPADRPIALHGDLRPGVAVTDDQAVFSVWAGESVYLYTQHGDGQQQNESPWRDLGDPRAALKPPPDSSVPALPGDTVLMLTRTSLNIYAVSNGQLFFRSTADGAEWQHMVDAVGVARLVPFIVVDDQGNGTAAGDDLLYVTNSGELFLFHAEKSYSIETSKSLDPNVYPLAIARADGSQVVLSQSHSSLQPTELLAYVLNERELDDFDDALPKARLHASAQAKLKSRTIGWTTVEPAVLSAALVLEERGLGVPATWDFMGNAEPTVGDAPARAALIEGPAVLGPYHLFEGHKGAVSITVPSQKLHSNVRTVMSDLFLFEPDVLPSADDLVLLGLVWPRKRLLTTAASTFQVDDSGQCALELSEPLQERTKLTSATVYIGDPERTLDGILSDGADGKWHLQLHEGDLTPVENTLLYLQDERESALIRVTAYSDETLESGGEKVTTRLLSFQAVDGFGVEALGGGILKYTVVKAYDTDAKPLPVLELNKVDAAIRRDMTKGLLKFQGAPGEQRVAYLLDEQERAILSEPWREVPSAPVRFDVFNIGVLGPYAVFEPLRGRNPELFWEYWNGSSWWRIPGVVDDTDNLLTSGLVTFCVPKDLQQVDVIGRKNLWIRARLTGGDFGQETVKVVTKKISETESEQKVVRSNDSIAAPYMMSLTIRYDVCCPVTPDHLLAEDGASIRNQTDANRTPGAVVEYFVPLDAALASFDSESTQPGGPALYLGFDVPLKGRPLTLLFIMAEGQHEAAYPVRLDALLGGQFRPLVVEDGTRGLNETGIISFELSESPQLTELFGQARYWLRIRPGTLLVDATSWQPRVKAAYLNAAWATAAETQSDELLGSSDGSPEQKVRLARQPVLADSLELRVREPLGEEDIADLRAHDPAFVLERVGHRGGPWVLWHEVIDPLDHDANERVYALDHQTGELRFGDGVHGMIPPIGRDVFLARRYKHGGGAKTSAIHAWSQISLLTPLPGVESADAPLDAAGGADPQDAPTTLRFAPANARIRERALTLADFEALAMQLSLDIAQVRALRRGLSVVLVVVVRGRQPTPSKELLRELRRYLLARCSPSWSADGALRLTPATLVPLRVRLSLTIPRLEVSGRVARQVTAHIAALLDPASGGLDGGGWRIGEIPSEADIAACLQDVPELELIDAISLLSGEEGDEPLRSALRPTELLQLVSDGVLIDSTVSASEGVA